MGTRYTLVIEDVTTEPEGTQVVHHGFGRNATYLWVNLKQGDRRLEVIGLDETQIEIRNPSETEVNVSDLIFRQEFSVTK